MRNAPFTMSAMLTLAVFLCLRICSTATACSECICFSDNTCSNVGCTENLTANCTRTVFTPACTGDYLFNTETICTGESGVCEKCQSCASIYKVVGGQEYWHGHCHTANCGGANPACNFSCGTISLIASDSYAVYVCKVPCPWWGSDCESCPNTCSAYACLSIGISAGPCRP